MPGFDSLGLQPLPDSEEGARREQVLLLAAHSIRNRRHGIVQEGCGPLDARSLPDLEENGEDVEVASFSFALRKFHALVDVGARTREGIPTEAALLPFAANETGILQACLVIWRLCVSERDNMRRSQSVCSSGTQA